MSNEVVMNNEMVKILVEVAPLQEDKKISINRAGN